MFGNFYIVKWYDIFPALWSLFVFVFIKPPPPPKRAPFLEDTLLQARKLDRETAALARALQPRHRETSLPYTLDEMIPVSYCPHCKRPYS